MKASHLKLKMKPVSARNKALKLRNKTALPESIKLKLALKLNADNSEPEKNDQDSNQIDSHICGISPINWDVNHEDDELFEKESTHSANANNFDESNEESFQNGRHKYENAISRGPYLPPKIKALFRNARYYLIKSCNHENVALAKSRCVWATPRCNEIRLNKAFEESENVILIFSVKESGRFQGYARISAKSDPSIRVGWVLPAGMNQRHLSGAFRIDWVSKSEVPFNMAGHLVNSWNENKPVKIGRDGQDIEATCGESLCRLFPLENERLIDALYYKNQSNRHVNDFRRNTPALLPSPVNLPPRQNYDNRNKSRNHQYNHGNRLSYNEVRHQTFQPPPAMNIPPVSAIPPNGLPTRSHLPPMNLAAPPPPVSMQAQFLPGQIPLQFAPQRPVAAPSVVPGLPPPMRPHQAPGAPPLQYVIHPGQPPISAAQPMPPYQPQPHVGPQIMPHAINPSQPPTAYPNPVPGHNFMPQCLPPSLPPAPVVSQPQHSYIPSMVPTQTAPPGIPHAPQSTAFPSHQAALPQHPQAQPVYQPHQAGNYGVHVDATQSQRSSEPLHQQQTQQPVPYIESGSSSWSVPKDSEQTSKHGSSHRQKRQKSPDMSRSSRRGDHHSSSESRRKSPDLDGIDKELLMTGNYHDYLRYSTGQDKRREKSKQKDEKSLYEDRVASFLMQLSSRDPPRKSSKPHKSRHTSPKRVRSSSTSDESRSRSREVSDYRKSKRTSPSHSRHRKKSRSNSRSRRRR